MLHASSSLRSYQVGCGKARNRCCRHLVHWEGPCLRGLMGHPCTPHWSTHCVKLWVGSDTHHTLNNTCVCCLAVQTAALCCFQCAPSNCCHVALSTGRGKAAYRAAALEALQAALEAQDDDHSAVVGPLLLAQIALHQQHTASQVRLSLVCKGGKKLLQLHVLMAYIGKTIGSSATD